MTNPSCACVYATAENTPSVRSGHEMGGYVKEFCESCKEREREQAKGLTALPLKLIEAILNKHHSAIVSELHAQVDQMTNDYHRALDALNPEPDESLLEWAARARSVRKLLRARQ